MDGCWDNLTDLWHGMCERMVLGPASALTVASLTVMRFDQVVSAESMEYEMDLSRELWMTRGRFTTLQRDYLDPAALEHFIDQTGKLNGKRPQIAQMLCRPKGQRHVSYVWGNCILGFTFRLCPRPTLTMHSRTTAITRMGGLDLALAYCIVDMIKDPADVRFVWHIDSVQHSTLNGTPYFYASGMADELLDSKGYDDKLYPALRLMRREVVYFDKLDARGEVQKHGTRRRVREQRRAFIEGRLKRPAVPLDTLTLDAVLEDR